MIFPPIAIVAEQPALFVAICSAAYMGCHNVSQLSDYDLAYTVTYQANVLYQCVESCRGRGKEVVGISGTQQQPRGFY